MSVDNKSERLPQDTLALIADKLSIVRPASPDPQPDLTLELKAEVSAESEKLPSLPPAAQLESVPVASLATHPSVGELAGEMAEDLVDDAPVPPPIPPAPPPPKIEPFVPVVSGAEPRPFPTASAAPQLSPVMSSARPSKGSRSSTIAIYLAVTIALCSLGLTIYQGMLFRQGIETLQRADARSEYARACRAIISAYFQIKPKIGALMPAPDRSNVAGASRISETSRVEAQAAIARFGGLGTYLANFQDAGTRARYTELTKLLTGIYDNARTTPLAEIDRVFAPADKLFGQMNDDCARLSRAMSS